MGLDLNKLSPYNKYVGYIKIYLNKKGGSKMRLVKTQVLDNAHRQLGDLQRMINESEKKEVVLEHYRNALVLAIRNFKTEALSYEGFYFDNDDADIIELADFNYRVNYSK